MRAAVLRTGAIVAVEEVADPVPAPGQVLLETLACGICGTDLHTVGHAEELVASSKASGMAIFDFDTRADLVMGHEFSGRVLEVGADAPPGLSPGQVVVAHPVVRVGGQARSVGYANDYPGGFAERVVVDAAGVLPVPAGLDPRWAALTEPTAVGLHAVNRSRATELGSAIVLGCGPVGLSVVAALAYRGVGLIIASDYSPTRRAFATRVGAHVAVDPAQEEPVAAWRAAGGRGPTVVVDAIGVPGIIDAAMKAAPRRSEILVVGLCMQTDGFWPAIGINKELSLTFALGWDAEEFAESLQAIAEGRIAADQLVTGEVGIDGVAGAFAALANPESHVKILVRPNT
jgi:2-desacetyl-2-hydroxyethyl bacteriochlorophyllide A dehydrogenase